MTYLLALLPAVICVAMMFGAGALGWLATKAGWRRRGQADEHETAAEA